MLEAVRKALAEEQKSFSLKAVSESEVRVLRILNFRTYWITPFDLTEQLISLLDLELESLPQFYAVALLYLKYSYSRHKEFYSKVELIVQDQWPVPDRPLTGQVKHFCITF